VAASGSLIAWERSWKPFLAFSTAVALVTASVGTVLYRFLLGPEYQEGASLVAVLSLAAIPYAVYQYDAAACQGLRDLRTGSVGAAVGALVLLAVVVPVIVILGTHGAAVGMIVVYTAMAVVVRRRLGNLRRRPMSDRREAVPAHG
jgi:O-antigen/teichoic acid export membrane protein